MGSLVEYMSANFWAYALGFGLAVALIVGSCVLLGRALRRWMGIRYESEAVRQKRAQEGSLDRLKHIGGGQSLQRLRTGAHRTPGGGSMKHEASTMVVVVQDPVEAPRSLWEHLDDAD